MQITSKLLKVEMRNFQDTFETRKRPFIGTFFHLHDCTFQNAKLNRVLLLYELEQVAGEIKSAVVYL